MFGGLRLLLALVVCLSHLGLTVGGHHPGVSAVIVFYLLAGYVTRALIEVQLKTPAAFYMERLIRLAPPYLGALAAATIVWLMVNPASHFTQRAPSLMDWIANISVVPLNYFMWTGQDRFTLVPPAWSLAVELQFYLLAPWLFRFNRLAISLTLASLVIYVVAGLGLINTDWWGYRLLPGVLFVFMIGAGLRSHPRLVALLVCFGSAILLAVLILRPETQRAFNVETAIGLMFGAPLLAALSLARRRQWDEVIGHLAYPVFLSHFLILWIFEALGLSGPSILSSLPVLALYILVTLAFSFCLYLATELPFVSLRRKLRSVSATTPHFERKSFRKDLTSVK